MSKFSFMYKMFNEVRSIKSNQIHNSIVLLIDNVNDINNLTTENALIEHIFNFVNYESRLDSK